MAYRARRSRAAPRRRSVSRRRSTVARAPRRTAKRGVRRGTRVSRPQTVRIVLEQAPAGLGSARPEHLIGVQEAPAAKKAKF